MKILSRLWRGGLLAAFVYFAYACATGAEDGREGFDDADGGAARDGSSPARAEAGSSSSSSSSSGGSSDDDAGPCDGKVVINELMTAGATAYDEFIELYNPGGCAVPLGGWKLGYRAQNGNAAPPILTFEPGSSIPAKAYLVIARPEFSGKKDVTITSSTSMAVDSGQVGLEDDKGTLVDAVGYGTATGAYVEGKPAPSPDTSGSIARKSNGVDTNDNAADFAKTKPHSAGAPNP